MSSSREFDELLDSYLEQQRQANRTPGMAVALFDRHGLTRISTYGFTDLEDHTPIKPNTLFEIGSITKSFTAIAVLQAAEQGKLDLQAPVTEILPWFKVQSVFAPITIGNLLSHTAGLVGVIDRSPDPRGAVWALRETEAAWPPGEHFYYSDAGYQTLGLALEEVTGRPFQEILRADLFNPLGMDASEPALTHTMRGRMAIGYRSLYDDRPYQASHPLVREAWIETNAADCCIAATASDMARFGRMLLQRGQGPDRPVLSSDSFDLLVEPRMPTGGGFEYGYGIEIHRLEELTYLGHAGGMPGYEAMLLLNTEHRLGVVLMSTTPSPPIRSLAWRVMGLWKRDRLGQSLEGVDLPQSDPARIDNANDYAGEYRGESQTMTIIAENDRLALVYRGERIHLERRAADAFYAHRPDFDRFLLRFGRKETLDSRSGEVIEVCFGPDWYTKQRNQSPPVFDYPNAWEAYPGHYRSHIPWQSNFRVLFRKGRLWLAWPDGNEEPLKPLQENLFRVGDEYSPERLRFSHIAGGKALCANYSGSDYYRFFTP